MSSYCRSLAEGLSVSLCVELPREKTDCVRPGRTSWCDPTPPPLGKTASRDLRTLHTAENATLLGDDESRRCGHLWRLTLC